LQIVNEIIRGASVCLNDSSDDIHKVTKYIFEKIKKSNPPNLRVVTFAILRLRDIADQGSWARHLFPTAPPYFIDENEDKSHYDAHISKLKKDFVESKVYCKSPTVVGALCEGEVGIDVLEVTTSDSTSVSDIAPNHKLVLVESALLTLGYTELFVALMEKGFCRDVASFVTMLSVLLRRWDVTVVTANNIIRGDNVKSGLCGVVLCFARGGAKGENVFAKNIPAFFSPILQLVTNAALLESARHFHERSEKLAAILAEKVRPAMELLEASRWDIREAIGGCFGEDLALFKAELEFRRRGNRSLYEHLEIGTLPQSETVSIGDSGIWHLKFTAGRIGSLHKWMKEVFPLRYVHLYDNLIFQNYFVNRVLEINNETSWDKYLSSGQPQNPDQLRRLYSKEEVYGRCIFKPHCDAIVKAVERNFKTVIRCEDGNDNKLALGIYADFTNESVTDYLKLVSDSGMSDDFAQIRHHPNAWLALYKGNVTIAWKDNNSNVIHSVSSSDIKKIKSEIKTSLDAASTHICTVEYSLERPSDESRSE